MKSYIYLLLFICSLVLPNESLAGSQQNQQAKFKPEVIAKFAKQVEKYAAEKRAYAFIIARIGQPEKDLPKGIKFTHTAVAIYSQITLENGEKAYGYAIHNLYQDYKNPNVSHLVTDYPVDFFWGVNALKAGIIIPDEKLQQRLVEAIQNGTNKTLHNPRYSLIANPNNNKYQNCTEHTLNLVNAAIYQTDNMQVLKRRTKAYFTPQKVHVSRFKLALGNMFAEGITTKDHPKRIETTTFTSIAKYLNQFHLANSAVILTPNETKSLI